MSSIYKDNNRIKKNPFLQYYVEHHLYKYLENIIISEISWRFMYTIRIWGFFKMFWE